MTRAPWRVSVITLMPEMYPGPLGASLVGDALSRGLWSLDIIPLRHFGIGPHQKVDDSPAGGGAGMVLMPQVVDAAISFAKEKFRIASEAGAGESFSLLREKEGPAQREDEGSQHKLGLRSLPNAPSPNPLPKKGEGLDRASPTVGGSNKPQLIHLSPRGEKLSQPLLKELSLTPLILLCGRYEAIDERVLEKHQPREVSLGDFVLTGGDIPAMALIDGCVRLLPGVVGKEASLGEESFGDGAYTNLLEYPHYTKPAEWEGRAIPEVLLSGHHKNIDTWRLAQAREITKKRRPDLMK